MKRESSNKDSTPTTPTTSTTATSGNSPATKRTTPSSSSGGMDDKKIATQQQQQRSQKRNAAGWSLSKSLLTISVVGLGLALLVTYFVAPLWFLFPKAIPVVPFEATESFQHKITLDRSPVKILHLTEESLLLGPAEFVKGVFKDVKVNASRVPGKSGVFADYDADRPLASWEQLPAIRPAEVMEVTVFGFWSRVLRGTDSLCYHGSVLQDFESVFGHFPEKLRRNLRTSNFLFLSPGARTQPHYTEGHTYLVNFYGNNVRVLLVPPAEFSHVYMFPFSHPNFRYSQVDFLGWPKSLQELFDRFVKFPDLKLVESYFEVSLSRGEAVYIPPFWLAQIVSSDNTILLESQSMSTEADAVLGLSRYPLPASHDADYQLFLGKKFSETLVEALLYKEHVHPREFIRDLVQQRYAPLFYGLKLTSDFDLSPCLGRDDETHIGALESLEQLLEDTTKILAGLRPVRGVFELVLQNYIDEVAAFSASGNHLYEYYAACFGDVGVTNVEFTEELPAEGANVDAATVTKEPGDSKKKTKAGKKRTGTSTDNSQAAGADFKVKIQE